MKNKKLVICMRIGEFRYRSEDFTWNFPFDDKCYRFYLVDEKVFESADCRDDYYISQVNKKRSQQQEALRTDLANFLSGKESVSVDGNTAAPQDFCLHDTAFLLVCPAGRKKLVRRKKKKDNGNSGIGICRVAVSLSFQARIISVTFRIQEKRSLEFFLAKEASSEFVFRIDHYTKAIYSLLTDGQDQHDPAGLVVFSGSTNAMKSLISKGVASEFISHQKKYLRVLTFEDPIETWWYLGWKGSSCCPPHGVAPATGILDPRQNPKRRDDEHFVSFTPRQKGVDTPGLEEATDDALRQSPFVVYIGEIRDDKDWKSAIKLAGTGHLVVTTTHAGSICETFSRIFKACDCRTPAEKGFIASRILGVTYIKGFTEQNSIDPEDRRVFDFKLPAVWTSNRGGKEAIISDGITSVAPNQSFSFGHEAVLKRIEEIRGQPHEIREHLTVRAKRLDLIGH